MAEHVEEDLGDAIDMIIDGGQVGIGLDDYDRRFHRGCSGSFKTWIYFTGNAERNAGGCSYGPGASDHG